MKYLLKLSAAAAISVLASSAATWAQDFTMRIAAGSSSAGWNCKEFLPAWAEKIKTASNGRIGYQIFCDGTLGKMGDTVNRVEAGIAEAGWDVPLAYGARFAPFGLVGLPGLYDDPGKAGAALWHAYESGALPKVTGVKLAFVQLFGNISLWSVKPIDSLGKLDGLKFGMGSKQRAVMLEKMGAVPLNLRVQEYYQALAKGSADGVFTTDTTIFDFSMTELLKQQYRAAFGGGIVAVFINQAWYDGLPADLKAVIDANTGYETSRWASQQQWNSDTARVAKAVEDKLVEARDLSADELAAWQPAFDAATQSWTASVPDGETYLAAFKAAMEKEAGN